MATPALQTEIKPRRSFARRLLRILFVVVLLLFVVAAAAGGWFYRKATQALPQLDGTLAVRGLQAPVTVLRDAQGVPHLTAESYDDLFFAQGFVTAQDRLWQLDALRRYASGELAEILGAGLVEHDKTQRILGLRQVAERAAQNLDERDRRYFEAYARGVNAYIEQRRGRLPIEFRVLGYDPKPWTPVDSLLVGAYMAQLLNHEQYEFELTREQVLAKVDPQVAADLFPERSWRDRVPGVARPKMDEVEPPPGGYPNWSRSSSPIGADLIERDAELVPGSNNWVLSGARTTTGKPILANDMHLPHQVPNTWYEAHLKLKSGEFDVTGVTLPGLPYVVVGHNQRIAWGFTNLGPDVQDLYIETFNGNGQYQAGSEWREPQRRREAIKVKGSPDVLMDVVVTRHGPIISELIPNEKRMLALRWTLFDTSAMTFPFFDVNCATDWDTFRAAFAKFAGPGQNVVYADVDGHIGYQATGFVPIRAAGDGTVPVAGNDDAHEWTGYIPFDEMPRVYDPPSGMLATANGRIAPDDYKYVITRDWFSPHRTERIYRVLDSGKKLAPADMIKLQTDIYSDFDRLMAQRLVYAVDQWREASPRARQAADLLRKWDGRFTAESVAPSIVNAAKRRLSRLVLKAKFPDIDETQWSLRAVAMEQMLLKRPERWLPKGVTNWDALLAKALDEAVAAESVPKDLNKWQWGNVNAVTVQHPIFGQIPGMGRWSGQTLPQSGGSLTVKQVGRRFGPSERMTVDFADFDASTLNIVSGQSGQLISPHYNDQWSAWYNGTTFKLAFTDAAVQGAARHNLTLTPQ